MSYDAHKLINHISWLFSACLEQGRYVVNDAKRAMTFTRFYNSGFFNKFYKHLHLSNNLLKQAEKTWISLIQNGRMNEKAVANLQVVYVKRSLFQNRLAMEHLSQIVYDVELNSDRLYKSLYSKMYNWGNLLGQLDHEIRRLSDPRPLT